MPLNLTPDQLAQLPAILLLGWTHSGKSQTLASWTSVFKLYERDAGPEGTGTTWTPLVQRARLAFRSEQLREYLVEIDRSFFRVFDIPGEVLNSPIANHAEQTTTAGRLLGQLLALEPKVAGVIVFATPPTEEDTVGCITDREQLEKDMGRVLAPHQVRAQLRDVLSLVSGFVYERLRDPALPTLHVTIQIGFNDLVSWQPANFDRVCSIHEQLRPGSSAGLRWSALKPREVLFSELDQLSRTTFAWLEPLTPTPPAAEVRCVPVSNLAIRDRDHRLPIANPGASLLSVVSQIERARQQRDARRRLMGWLGASAAAAVVGMIGLYQFLAHSAPERLPAALAVRACANTAAPGDRCACMDVLARHPGTLAMRERLALVTPYVAACRSWVFESPQSLRIERLGLAAQVELARAALTPSEFVATRYQAAVEAGGRPGNYPGPMPWYPADSAGEIRAMELVQSALAGGEVPPPARLAQGLDEVERSELGALLKLLESVKTASPCLREWTKARETGNWRSVPVSCGRDAERVPADMRACFFADSGMIKVGSSPMAAVCDPASVCGRRTGLDALLLRAPAPDAMTYANLAASAGAPEPFSQCIARAATASPAQLLLLRLLGPVTADDRMGTVRSAADSDWNAASDLLRKDWVVAETGRRVVQSGQRSSAQRAPVLPLANAVTAACALVDLQPAPPATSGTMPWREPIELEPIDQESADTHRARLALTLLAASTEPRTRLSAGCEITAAITVLRLPPGPEQRAIVARLNSALEFMERGPNTAEEAIIAAGAARLRCRLGPAFAESASAAATFATRYGCTSSADPSSGARSAPDVPAQR